MFSSWWIELAHMRPDKDGCPSANLWCLLPSCHWVSLDYVALTSFLMRNFPDQYLFVLQYWVSSSTAIRGNIRYGQHKSKKTHRKLVSIPACDHCLMCGDWRQTRNVECCWLGPGPPQAETHWQKWLMMCSLSQLGPPGPHQLMVWCLIWHGGGLH